MTNLGHHALDIMHWTLGGLPTAITSVGGRLCLQDNGETPDTQDALFEFPGNDGRNGSALGPASTSPWTAAWSHREASAGFAKPMPTEFYGTRGMLGITRKGFTVVADKKVPPENLVPRFTGDPPVGGVQKVESSEGDELWTTAIEDRSGADAEQFTLHVRNFLDCVKSRATPISDLASAHRVSTMCHLANISLRLGRKLRWDPTREDVIGDAEASAQLSRPYRAPWDSLLKAVKG
jgi:predicted dehydrogenase